MNSTGTATQTATEERLYRIGEVSRLSELKPFVLRYWETEFPMLEPVKSASGHRLYRAEDVNMVLRIKRLLYDEGFTIAGARRHLREPQSANETHVGEFHLTSPDNPDAEIHGESRPEFRGEHRGAEVSPPLLNRKMLLDLRDSLRAFLTLLERR